MFATGIALDTGQPSPVVLRRLTAADAEVFAAHVVAAHAHLSPFLTWPDRTVTPDGARTWLADYEQQLDGRVVAAGLWLPDRLIGGVTLLHHDPVMAIVELGVWVIPDAAGRGIAAAACVAATTHARAELGVERVVYQCATGNRASRRLAERLGFVHEGTSRSDYVIRGVRHDTDVLSLVGAELDR